MTNTNMSKKYNKYCAKSTQQLLQAISLFRQLTGNRRLENSHMHENNVKYNSYFEREHKIENKDTEALILSIYNSLLEIESKTIELDRIASLNKIYLIK